MDPFQIILGNEKSSYQDLNIGTFNTAQGSFDLAHTSTSTTICLTHEPFDKKEIIFNIESTSNPQASERAIGAGDQITGAPNNTAISHDILTLKPSQLKAGQSKAGRFSIANKKDLYGIDLKEGYTYTFQLQGLGKINPFLTLYDQNGKTLLYNNNKPGDTNAKISYSPTSQGRYLLEAQNTSLSKHGRYTILALAKRDDFADSVATKGTLETGKSRTGNLEFKRDHDWFRINLSAGKIYDFRVESNSLRDPYLYLRNGNGEVLQSNDDESPRTRNSFIRFTADKSNDYYLDVGAFADAYTGSYTLKASVVESDLGYSDQDGYGEASALRAIELLLGRNLPARENLGGIYWGLDRLGAPELWASGFTGQGQTIAVVDTGVDYNHIDLDTNIWKNTNEIEGNGVDDDQNGFIDDCKGWDFIDNDNSPMDMNSHGTHVAGIIAAKNNGIGQIGIAFNSKIMPVRVLNASGSGSYNGVANGIRYAANNGASIINLSLGGSAPSSILFDAIDYAANRGCVVVMAAGNSSGSSPGYPGTYSEKTGITVGAINYGGLLANFSNRSGTTKKDYVTAAGVNIFSCLRGNQFGYMSGTSMATPLIAGAAALLRNYNPLIKAADIESLLCRSASHTNSTLPFSMSTSRLGAVASTLGNHQAQKSDNLNAGHLIPNVSFEEYKNLEWMPKRDSFSSGNYGNRLKIIDMGWPLPLDESGAKAEHTSALIKRPATEDYKFDIVNANAIYTYVPESTDPLTGLLCRK